MKATKPMRTRTVGGFESHPLQDHSMHLNPTF